MQIYLLMRVGTTHFAGTTSEKALMKIASTYFGSQELLSRLHDTEDRNQWQLVRSQHLRGCDLLNICIRYVFNLQIVAHLLLAMRLQSVVDCILRERKTIASIR